jgi:hypothetical protein
VGLSLGGGRDGSLRFVSLQHTLLKNMYKSRDTPDDVKKYRSKFGYPNPLKSGCDLVFK